MLDLQKYLNRLETKNRELSLKNSEYKDLLIDRAEAEKWGRRELRSQIKAPLLLKAPAPPTGQYSCIVIDPPWEMEKIDRDVRPKQKQFDYAPMSEDELAELKLPA